MLAFPSHPATGWNPGTPELSVVRGERTVDFGDQKAPAALLFCSGVSSCVSDECRAGSRAGGDRAPCGRRGVLPSEAVTFVSAATAKTASCAAPRAEPRGACCLKQSLAAPHPAAVSTARHELPTPSAQTGRARGLAAFRRVFGWVTSRPLHGDIPSIEAGGV